MSEPFIYLSSQFSFLFTVLSIKRCGHFFTILIFQNTVSFTQSRLSTKYHIYDESYQCLVRTLLCSQCCQYHITAVMSKSRLSGQISVLIPSISCIDFFHHITVFHPVSFPSHSVDCHPEFAVICHCVMSCVAEPEQIVIQMSHSFC
jgi:hypothetical protein